MAIGQFNVARARWDFDDARMKPFFDAVPMMNALAERSPGFVWRKVDDSEVMALPFFVEDRRLTLTLSVWDSVESLRHFTWNTLHKKFRLRTHEWFEKLDEAYVVMWPIADDHRPDGPEAIERLKELRRTGPTESVFGTEALTPKETV